MEREGDGGVRVPSRKKREENGKKKCWAAAAFFNEIVVAPPSVVDHATLQPATVEKARARFSAFC